MDQLPYIAGKAASVSLWQTPSSTAVVELEQHEAVREARVPEADRPVRRRVGASPVVLVRFSPQLQQDGGGGVIAEDCMLG